MPTPVKMAGNEMSRMLELMVASSAPSVVFESATHLYFGPTGRCRRPVLVAIGLSTPPCTAGFWLPAIDKTSCEQFRLPTSHDCPEALTLYSLCTEHTKHYRLRQCHQAGALCSWRRVCGSFRQDARMRAAHP